MLACPAHLGTLRLSALALRVWHALPDSTRSIPIHPIPGDLLRFTDPGIEPGTVGLSVRAYNRQSNLAFPLKQRWEWREEQGIGSAENE